MPPRRLALWIAATALFAGCDGADEPSKKFRSTPPSRDDRQRTEVYPFERTMVDSQERTLDVVVVGRTSTAVVFTKHGSTKRYRHPLHALSAEDRRFIEALPIKEWGSGDNFTQSLDADRRRIAERIANMEAEIARAPGAQMRIRSLEREIGKLKAEDKRLAQQIHERKK